MADDGLMNIKSALRFGAERLKDISPSYALDTRILLAFSMELSQEAIISDGDAFLSKDQEMMYKSYIERRRIEEPIAYIIGEKEFYGLRFSVSKHTLIPRPDSETVVDAAILYIKEYLSLEREIKLLDVCTGSGALIISIMHYLPDSFNIYGVGIDISSEALRIAKLNKNRLLPFAKHPNKKLYFLEEDILSEYSNLECDILVCNPPYISSIEIQDLQNSVKDYEPIIALDGGENGLRFYENLALKIMAKIAIFEIGIGQESEITDAFERQNFILVASLTDISKIVRVLVFRTFK